MLIEAREGAVVTLTLNNPAKRNALALPLGSRSSRPSSASRRTRRYARSC